MARSRNIKPGFFQNDELSDLDPIDRLFFIGLWTICDFRGCVEYRPKKLKAQILPYDNVDVSTIATNLDKSGFIRLYSIQEKNYLKVVNFSKHQNPHKNERAAGSDIPDFNKIDSQPIDFKRVTINPDKDGTNPDKDGTAPADSLLLIPDSLIPDQSEIDQEFDMVWKLYGNKGNKKTCKAKYSKLSETKKQKILAHIPNYVISTPDKQYRKNFETYLNQEAWEDTIQDNQSLDLGQQPNGRLVV